MHQHFLSLLVLVPRIYLATMCRTEEGQLYYTMEFAVEGSRQRPDGSVQVPAFSRHNVSVYAVRWGQRVAAAVMSIAHLM